MPVHRRDTHNINFAGTHLYTWVERGTVGVKCLAQEHNTMSPTRAPTWTARSGDECTNHEATAPHTTSDIFCVVINCGNERCDPRRCTRPSWAETLEPDFSIDNKTVRKGTIMVPTGGYVVINFISDNPGWWFLHCHIEIHQLQGKAMIVNEISDEPLRPPKGMKNCGDFELRKRRS